jgi:hypothetical protein
MFFFGTDDFDMEVLSDGLYAAIFRKITAQKQCKFEHIH